MGEDKQPDEGSLTESILEDAPLYGPDGRKIGAVGQIHGKGGAMQVIVSLGGFLGVGAKVAVLRHGDVQFERGDDGSFRAVTQLTNDELVERSQA